MNEAEGEVAEVISKCISTGSLNGTQSRTTIRESLAAFLYQKIRRRPMILPVVMEV